MPRFHAHSRALAATALVTPLLLGGCDMVVLNPAGDVAKQQADLILWSTGLMLLIVVPVLILTGIFAWRYRAGNKDAEYQPDWDHSTGLELVIWSMPLLIIIALGALTWLATHTLDPYRPLARTGPGKLVAQGVKPLEVDVVSLDWKWLFIYPEQGIATVNSLVLPVDRPVHFRMSSSSVMNAFYVPAMAGMVYTMPGMETQLHAVLNRPGRFEGISSNYSGAGFSGMHFWTDAVDDAGFNAWVDRVRSAPGRLTADDYLELSKPSENTPVTNYATVEPTLFKKIVEQCVRPGQTCMSQTMAHDMKDMGSHAPVNDSAVRPGQAKGAINKTPAEKGSSPHRNAPHDPNSAPGSTNPGDAANRNMSSLDRPALPGTVATARS